MDLLIAEEVAQCTNAIIISGILHTDDGDRSHYWCIGGDTIFDPVFHQLRKQEPQVWKETTDGGLKEFKKYIERYRAYQI